jgi:hypothetical protein
MKWKFFWIGAVLGVGVAYFRTHGQSASKGNSVQMGPAAFRGQPSGSGFGG